MQNKLHSFMTSRLFFIAEIIPYKRNRITSLPIERFLSRKTTVRFILMLIRWANKQRFIRIQHAYIYTYIYSCYYIHIYIYLYLYLCIYIIHLTVNSFVCSFFCHFIRSFVRSVFLPFVRTFITIIKIIRILLVIMLMGTGSSELIKSTISTSSCNDIRVLRWLEYY